MAEYETIILHDPKCADDECGNSGHLQTETILKNFWRMPEIFLDMIFGDAKLVLTIG